jgi:cystathionine beta-lyase/cystathionine gamma-synthase
VLHLCSGEVKTRASSVTNGNDSHGDGGKDDEWLVFSSHPKFGYTYNRSGSTSLNAAQRDLATMYAVDNCFMVPSGMCAISTVLNALLMTASTSAACGWRGRNVNIIHGHQLYSDTPKVLSSVSMLYGVESPTRLGKVSLHSFDIRDSESFESLMISKDINGGYNILFVESCSNPDGYIMSPQMMATFRIQSSQSYVIMDNTWLTCAVFNPFRAPYEADCVVTSLTKYYSSGCAIGGAILLPAAGSPSLPPLSPPTGSPSSPAKVATTTSASGTGTGRARVMTTLQSMMADQVLGWIRTNGLHVSPHNARIIHRGLKTLRSRMTAASANITAVLAMLTKLASSSTPSQLIEIKHPSLSSHPRYVYSTIQAT